MREEPIISSVNCNAACESAARESQGATDRSSQAVHTLGRRWAVSGIFDAALNTRYPRS